MRNYRAQPSRWKLYHYKKQPVPAEAMDRVENDEVPIQESFITVQNTSILVRKGNEAEWAAENPVRFLFLHGADETSSVWSQTTKSLQLMTSLGYHSEAIDLPGNARLQAPLATELSLLAAELSTLTAELSPLATELSPLARELSPLPAELSPLAAELSPLSAELSPLAAELSPLAAELSPLAAELSPLATELSPLARELSPLPAELSPLAAELSPLSAELSPLAAELSPLAAELSPLPAELLPLATELSPLAAELSPLTAEPSTLAAELSPLAEELSPLPAELSPLSAELSPLAAELLPLAAELSPLARELSPLADELSPLATELSPLSAELSPLTAELSPLAAELSPLAAELLPLAAELLPLATDLSPLAAELSPLAAELSTLTTELSPLAAELSPLATELSPLAAELSPLAGEHSPLADVNDPMARLSRIITVIQDVMAFMYLLSILCLLAVCIQIVWHENSISHPNSPKDVQFWATFDVLLHPIPDNVTQYLEKHEDEINITEKTMMVRDNLIHVLEAEPIELFFPTSGKEVLLLHGYETYSDTWTIKIPTMQLLSILGHKSVTLDLPELFCGYVPIAPIMNMWALNFSGVHVPTLIVYGEKDTDNGLLTKEDLLQIPSSLPPLMIFEGSHAAHLDDPDTFHLALFNFLQDQGQPRDGRHQFRVGKCSTSHFLGQEALAQDEGQQVRHEGRRRCEFGHFGRKELLRLLGGGHEKDVPLHYGFLVPQQLLGQSGVHVLEEESSSALGREDFGEDIFSFLFQLGFRTVDGPHI
eukprot:maker-scaffold392_size185621-snap-gene-0.21 protein:Tk05912 transcript:maker-scaffold392_size185621-snap-gene-0.21-mRNA-1 annotation:"predicted protein"